MSGIFNAQYTFASSDTPGVTADHGAPSQAMLQETQDKAAHDKAARAQQQRQASPHLPEVQLMDAQAADATARALKEALDRTRIFISSPDVCTVETLLRNAKPEDLEAIRRSFEHLSGKTLNNYILEHVSAVDAHRLLGLANRKDNSPDVASEIQIALEQRSWIIEGPSHEACEATIREKLSRMSAAEIDQLRLQYKERYGKSLDDALLNDRHLSASTKAAVSIFLHGADKRSDDQTLKLFDVAIQEHDLKRLQEASSGASETARKQFFASGGEQRLKDAFKGATEKQDWKDVLLDAATFGLYSTSDNIDTLKGKKVEKAREIAADGKPSAATEIYENKALLGNNREAIAQVLAQMTDDERQKYFVGKAKAGGDAKSLSAPERDAVEYYNKLHDVLDSAAGRLGAHIGNSHDRELLKWEDMIRTKGGGTIARLAEHGGYIYNDSKQSIVSSIENMTECEWNAAKKDPDSYKRDAEHVLGIVLSNENDRKQAMDLLNEKLSAKSYKQAAATGKRGILDVVQDNKGLRADAGKFVDPMGWITSDSSTIVQALAVMTDAEKQQYRTNSKFHQELDGKVKTALGDGPEYAAARRELDNIAAGKPATDVIVDLYMCASKRDSGNADAALASAAMTAFMPALAITGLADATLNDGKGRGALVGSGAAAGVHALDEALNGPDGAELRARLKSDQAFRDDLTKALHAGLDQSEFDRYAKPLLDGGTLPEEVRMQLDKSLFHDDKKSILSGLTMMSQQERDAVLNDPQQRERLLGSMPPDVQDLAMKIIQQKEIKPEDKARAAVLGYGFDASDLKEMFGAAKSGQKLGAEEREQIRQLYADKYHSDLLADIASNMKARDRDDLTALLERPPESAAEAIDRKERMAQKNEETIGTKLVGHFWDGTDKLTTENLNDFQTQITQAARQHKKLTPEQVEQLTANFDKSLSMLRDSRGAMADGAVDAALAAGVIVGSFVPGVNFAILAGAGIIGGALLKPAAKSVMLGSDYDCSARGVIQDVVTGGVNGFINCVGPGEIAAIMKMGEEAGIMAAKEAMLQAGKQLGEQVLKEGADKLAQDGMTKLVRDSLAHGMKDVDEQSIRKLAESLVAQKVTGYERDAAVKQLSEQLEKQLKAAIEDQSRSFMRNALRRYALNGGAGAAGGSTAAAVESGFDWDPNLSVEENVRRSAARVGTAAAIGAAGGAAFTLAADVGGSLVRAAKIGKSVRPELGVVDPDEVFRLPARKIDPNEDMTGRIENVTHTKESFEDFTPGQASIEQDARVYKLRGKETEIVVPEHYAMQLDELRSLRKTANMSIPDNPTNVVEILSARSRLAKDPLRDALLPEQMGQLIDELPNPAKVRRIEMSPYGKPANSEGDFLGDAWAGGNNFRVFLAGNKSGLMRSLAFHETAHLIQGGEGWDAFKSAAAIEKDGYYARNYAKTSDDENFAVHFGENLLAPDPAVFKKFSDNAPLRAAIMGDMLRQQLEQAPEQLRSPFHQQFLDRVRYINENVAPRAKLELTQHIKAGDPAALELMQTIAKSGNWQLFDNLVDMDAVRTLAASSSDVGKMVKIARLFSSLPPGEGGQMTQHVYSRTRDLMVQALRSSDAQEVKTAAQFLDRQLSSHSEADVSFVKKIVDPEVLKSIAANQSDDGAALVAARVLARISDNRLPDDVINRLFRISHDSPFATATDMLLHETDSAAVQIRLLQQEAAHDAVDVARAVSSVSDSAGKLDVLKQALDHMTADQRNAIIDELVNETAIRRTMLQYLKERGLRPDLLSHESSNSPPRVANQGNQSGHGSQPSPGDPLGSDGGAKGERGNERRGYPGKDGTDEQPRRLSNQADADEDLEEDGSKMQLAEARQIIANKPADQWQDAELMGIMHNWLGLNDVEKETLLAQFHALDGEDDLLPMLDNQNKAYVLAKIKEYGAETLPPSARKWFSDEMLIQSRGILLARSQPKAGDTPMGKLVEQWDHDFRSHLTELSENGIVQRQAELVHQCDELTLDYDRLEDAANDLGLDLGKPADYDEFKSIYKPSPENKAEFDEFVAKRDQLQPELKSVTDEIDSRVRTLQAMVNDYATKLGIPAPEVSFNANMENLGEYKPSDHSVRLRTNLLENPAQLSRTLAHELTHAEQYTLITRNIAEKLNIHDGGGAADIERIHNELLNEAGCSMPDAAIEEALHNQTPLSAEERNRAERLAAGALDKRTIGETLGVNERVMRSLDRLKALLKNDAPMPFIESELGKSKLALFSGQSIPAYVQSLMDSALAGDSSAKNELVSVLTRYAKSAEQRAKIAQDIIYRQRLHEQEAHAVGNAVGGANDAKARNLLRSIFGADDDDQ